MTIDDSFCRECAQFILKVKPQTNCVDAGKIRLIGLIHERSMSWQVQSKKTIWRRKSSLRGWRWSGFIKNMDRLINGRKWSDLQKSSYLNFKSPIILTLLKICHLEKFSKIHRPLSLRKNQRSQFRIKIKDKFRNNNQSNRTIVGSNLWIKRTSQSFHSLPRLN